MTRHMTFNPSHITVCQTSDVNAVTHLSHHEMEVFSYVGNGSNGIFFPIVTYLTETASGTRRKRRWQNFVHGELIGWLWFAIGRSHVSDRYSSHRGFLNRS